MISDVEHLSMYLLVICVSSLEKMSIQFFCPFFNQVVCLMLSCMSCLYMLDINPLSVISFAVIFSHSTGCVFILFMVSFVVQKVLNLIRSHLFIFAFVSFALGDGSKKKKQIAAIYVKECSAYVFL